MAPPANAYDPMKSVEGMFNGSLSRLAYFFKDPKSYGQQTKTVLRETAKRYQDALDDCEIQILEAKWYLEHQLALNRARRAQKASETGAATAKRKLDSTEDASAGDGEIEEENPAKRVKTQDSKDGDDLLSEDRPSIAEKPAGTAKAASPGDGAEVVAADIGDSKPEPGTVGQPDTGMDPLRRMKATEEGKPMTAKPDTRDDQRPSGEGTPAQEAQDYDFDSMFDDPSGAADANNADLDFSMDLGGDTFTNALDDANSLGQTSLGSLLPGVETYANQTGDDLLMNFNTTSSNAGLGHDINATNAFDLPEIGDSTFDDFLNDDSLGGGLGGGGGGGGDDILNDDSMMNLGELDDSFFN